MPPKRLGTSRPPAADGDASGPGAEGEGPTQGRRRILVVDDSESNRLLVLLQLDRLGYEAVAADSGWAALDRLAKEPFDLVLLDGMMPGLDGPGTAREVRRREARAGLVRMPIVGLTASVLPEDRTMVLEAGMDDHLAKPFGVEELARVLDRWLAEASSPRRGHLPAPDLTPAQALPHDGSDPVVDPAVFARLTDIGDPLLTARLVRLFLSDAAERVRQADAALAAQDTVRLQAALEALEGVCSSLGAVALLRGAHRLHDEAVLMEREGRGPGPTATALGGLLRETQAWFDKAVAPKS